MGPGGDSQLSQPNLKKRRSTFELLREQKLAREARSEQASQLTSRQVSDEQGCSGQALQPPSKLVVEETGLSAEGAEESNVLVAVSNEEPQALASLLYQTESISDEVGRVAAHEAECAEEAVRFDAVARHRSKQLEAKWRSTLQRRDSKIVDEPVLTSVQDITSDFSVKSGLHIATPHGSFKWLRRLPLALRRGSEGSLKGAARDAALAVCKEHLPTLMENTDMALKWMDKLCAQLCWFEVEGPLVLSTSVRQTPQVWSAVPEERSAKRRMEEWDEAFRSLQVLLCQGLISSFVIASERFTVTVFGEGAGPWESAQSSSVQQPSQKSPSAVLCPSQPELRTMFAENHVMFDIADFSNAPATDQPGNDDTASTAIVPIVPGTACRSEANHSDLRDLRRAGERVVTPDEMRKAKPPSTALWFEGAWRVHGMLDVLRQFFLSGPLVAAPPSSPSRLPRLISPMAFSHAAVHSAEIVKTQTVQTPAPNASAPSTIRDKGASGQEERHTVELSGCFFPGQVRRLLELLRVPLPKFECRLACEPRHSTGINAFTRLGMYRLVGVRCQKSERPEADNQWDWDFELASS